MASFIPLRSEEGERLLGEVRAGHGYIQPVLLALFTPQLGNSNCGIQTSALMLSAVELSEKYADIKPSEQLTIDTCEQPFTEQAMFSLPATQQVATSTEQVTSMHGLTLQQVIQLLTGFSQVQVQKRPANESSVDDFRRDAINVLKNTNSCCTVGVNYSMKELGQCEITGHHSPLGAYHAASDRLLILDVWRATEPCWARTDALYRAINTLDATAGEHRGYFTLQKTKAQH